MLRNLPEGSRFLAAMHYDKRDPNEELEPLDERTEAIMDSRVWTIDRRLSAMQINAIYMNVAVSGAGCWPEGKTPEFPTIGPASWQPKTAAEEELKDNFDVLRKMGWPGA